MDLFKGDCEVFKDGTRLCSGTYEIYIVEHRGGQKARIGVLEVKKVSQKTLVKLFNTAHSDPEFQLEMEAMRFNVRLRPIDTSLDVENGYAKFGFEFVGDTDGKFK